MANLPHLDPCPNEENDHHPCVPLDKKESIKAMKVVSVAVLTMIAALSTYSANKFAPEARRRLAQEMLLISPNVCIAAALIGVALSYCASESNGLAEYAAIAIILVCVFGIGLGASAVVIILDTSTVPVFCIYYLTLAVLFGWGWLFSYPTGLKFLMLLFYRMFFNRRRIRKSSRALYANPRSAHQTNQKGFARIISGALAAIQRAFTPLDDDATIDIMNTFAPSVLTPISALSLWAANSVAPQAFMSPMMQRFLYILPYVYLPLGVIGIALATAASKSNGLANYASGLGVLLCACGVLLGGSCTVVIFQTPLLGSMLVAYAVIWALIFLWGWVLAYPKILNYAVRHYFCSFCARQNCWAWIFVSLRVLGRNVVRFARRSFDFCSRTARCWWNPRRAPYAGGGLDVEAGPAGVELTHMALSQSSEVMLIPQVVGMTR